MAKKEKFSVKIARGFINLIPNTKIFHDLANLYIGKYNNSYNIDIYTNGEYRFLKQAIESRKNPIIFDVGANIGHWTESVLKTNPSAIIHAFEPSPTSFPVLSQKPFPQTATINNLGLGDKKQVLTFYEYGNEHTHNSLYPRHDKPYKSEISIPVDTLSNYCIEHAIEHINYLKIDTEGHDYHVLVGAKSFLEQEKIDVIQFDNGNNYIDARIFLKDIFDLIAPLNYSLYRIMSKNLRPIHAYHEVYERFTYSNFVIINKKIMQGLV